MYIMKEDEDLAWLDDLADGKVVDIVGKLNYGESKSPVPRNQSWWMPNWKYLDAPRMLITGGSGTGKTVTLLSMIIGWLDFDTIIVCAADIEERKYDYLRKWCEKTAAAIDEENESIERLNRNRRGKDKIPLKEPLRYLFINDIQDLPMIDAWSEYQDLQPGEEIPQVMDSAGKPMLLNKYKSRRTLIVIDDMINEELSKQKNIATMFTRGRKRDMMIVYLAHSFFAIPEKMRKNNSAYIFFGGINKRNALDIAKGIECNLDPKEFVEVYQDATEPDADNENPFLYIDNTSKKGFRVRRNFKEHLLPD